MDAQSAQSPMAQSTPSLATPGYMAGGETPGTPGLAMQPATPGLNEPQSPLLQQHMQGGVSATSAAAAVASEGDGFMPGVEICCKRDYDSEMAGRRAVIRSLTDKSCIVQFRGEGDEFEDEIVEMPRGAAELVVPSKKDQVIVLRGPTQGTTGELFGIDARDGIVKTRDQGIIIVRHSDLGKWVPML